MSWRRRLAIWRLRLHLRIGPSVSDTTIAAGLDNLNWRFNAIGHDDLPDVLGLLAAVDRASVVGLLVSQAARPRRWEDD